MQNQKRSSRNSGQRWENIKAIAGRVIKVIVLQPAPKKTTNKKDREKSTKQSVPGKRKLVFALDYGTTFSGAAYAYYTDGDNVNEIQLHGITKWKGSQGSRRHAFSQRKVPSTIAYLVSSLKGKEIEAGNSAHTSPHNEKHSAKSKLRWGHETPVDKDSEYVIFEWVKLMTDPEAPEHARSLHSGVNKLDEVRKKMEKYNLDATTIIADYLDMFWDHVKELAIEENPQMGREWDIIDKTVVMTIPAIWSIHALSNFLTAVNRTSLNDKSIRLHLVKEPEAAAIEVLYSRKGTLMSTEISDDKTRYVVCDAGGGTVDLITYEVGVQIGEDGMQQLKLIESTVGDGALCGSIFLDFAFLDYMKTVLGDDFKELTPKRRAQMMNDFTDIKERFDPEAAEQDWQVDVIGCPDSVVTHVQGASRSLTTVELQNIFDPINSKVRDLIQTQVERCVDKKFPPPTGIILVGGLGCNSYLRKSLSATTFKTNDGKWDNIPIYTAPSTNFWSTVAFGAVRSAVLGFESVITAVSRVNFGYKYVQAPETGRNGGKRKDNNGDGSALPPSKVKWFLKRGETYFPSEKLSLVTDYAIEPEELDKSMTCKHEIVISDAETVSEQEVETTPFVETSFSCTPTEENTNIETVEGKKTRVLSVKVLFANPIKTNEISIEWYIQDKQLDRQSVSYEVVLGRTNPRRPGDS